MKPALLVACTGWHPETWSANMRAALPDRPILATERSGACNAADSELADAHYVLAWKPRQDVLDRLPNLRVMFSLGAGVDHLFALPRLPDVPVVRIVDPDLTARMTEYVVWQVLHHHRQGAAYARLQAERVWRDLDQPAARDVAVGMMGLGVLGRDAAEVLARLGFRMRGWSRTPNEVPGMEVFSGPDGLDAFLAGTDILVALLPLTEETRHLIGRTLLRKLRRDGPLGGPVLINAGRGGSHVEADIVEALRDGTLKGASLDVFQTEPLPPDSPLWPLENLAITPHAAAVSDPVALAGQIASQIDTFERGETLRNLADRGRGY